MGIVICNHCNKKVSDVSGICAYCGHKFNGSNEIYSMLQNSSVVKQKNNTFTICPVCNRKESEPMSICPTCGYFVGQNNEIPNKTRYSNVYEEKIPTCPRCGSTYITAGARGVNMTWGLIGASKTVNRCANCGHTWKPRK